MRLRTFGAFVVSICAMATAGAAVPAKPIEVKPIVFVTKATTEELSEVLTYPARVEPRIKASVLADTDGVITKIIAPLGSVVKAHAPLLIIRNTDPVYRYSPMSVSAPVAGVVSRVEVTEGSRVVKGDKLALVTDPTQVRVVVEVTADDVRLIKNGQAAFLTLPTGSPDEKVPLKVRGISPFVDPATGTALCELESLNPKGKLPLPGAIARVSFRANVRKGISIVDNAITYRGRDPFVRVVSEGKAKLVAVTLGRKQAGFIEITKGLKAGDQVIERASKFVGDGEQVEVQQQNKVQKQSDAASPAKQG